MVQPGIDLVFFKTPLADKFNRGNLVGLEPLVNRAPGDFKVICQIINRHEITLYRIVHIKNYTK